MNIRKCKKLFVHLLLGSLVFSCAGFSEGRISRHFERESWGEAISGHWSSWETQALPEMVGLAYLPYVRRHDQFWSHELSETVDTSERAGLNVVNVLELSALSMGVFDFFRGDEGAMVETWIEAETVNHFLNEGLKSARGRTRPNGVNDASFPSGSTQNAFLGATLAARWIEDQGNGWEYKLGYALYLPAGVVARSRVENQKHWYSDVIAGAVLGTIVANTFYNLHFGDRGSGKGGIFPRDWSRRVSVQPIVSEQGVGLGLVYDF